MVRYTAAIMSRKQIVSNRHDSPHSRATKPKEEPLLSPPRAFVLQFYPETDVQHDHFVGRVEHVVSGQTARFASLDILLAFLKRVLTAIQSAPAENQ
jgi:hypothetical protein